MTPRLRTLLVVLLAVVVAIRVSASQSLTSASARVAADPGGMIGRAFTGWSDLGTLGGASVQGIRDLPLALWFWCGGRLGLSDAVLQTCWRGLVMAVAVLGAVRLARGLDERRGSGRRVNEPWTPWVAAVLYGAGVALVPTLMASPLDGLAAATLPWAVAPLLRRRELGWRSAAGAAAWIGLAGFGSIEWAGACLGAALVAAVSRALRGDPAGALRWVPFAALAATWWVALAVWSAAHVRDVSSLLPDPSWRGLVDVQVGADSPVPMAVLAVLLLGPLLTAVTALALRVADVDTVFVATLAVGAVLAVLAWFLGAWPPVVPAPAAGEPVASVVGPALGWTALAALVSWGPLLAVVGPRFRDAWRARSLPATARDGVPIVAGVAVVIVSVAGLAAAAVERPGTTVPDELLDGVSAWSRSAEAGRVLVLPAGQDSFDVGAALGDRAWVGRDEVPTSGSAGTRALDDLIGRLERGDGGPGTASAVRRLGISYVLVQLGGPMAADRDRPTALMRSALSALGAERETVVGGDAPDTSPADSQLVDFGVRSAARQVEIWSLQEPADAWLYDQPPMEVVGDAGSVSDLAAAGGLGNRAVTLVEDPDGSSAAVLSDSARRRDVDQRVPVDPYGPDLTADEPRVVVPGDAAPVDTASRRVNGVEAVSASSSAADLGGDHRRAGTDAPAALDANVFTAWQSRAGTGAGEWWQVEFEAPRSLAGATVQFARSPFDGREVTRAQVTTDQGSSEVDVPGDGLLTLTSAEPTAELRITVLDVRGETSSDDSVGIAEVTVPDLVVREDLVVAGGTPSAWVLAARTGSIDHCVPAVPRAGQGADQAATVCDRGLSVTGPDAGSLRRSLDGAAAGKVDARVWARAVGTDQAAALADRLAEPSVRATASSVAAQDLSTRAQAAADADPTTAWRPAPEEAYPSLELAWDGAAEISGLRLVPPTGDVASVATRVRVTAERSSARGSAAAPTTVEADVDPDGLVVLPPVRADSLTVTILADSGQTTLDSATGGVRQVPVAVAEVELVGGPAVEYDADTAQRLSCGSGPTLSVAGKRYPTSLTTSARAVVTGAVVRADTCRSPELPGGEVEIEAAATFTWLPLGVLLTPVDGPPLTTEAQAPAPHRLLPRLAGRTTLDVELSAGGEQDRSIVLAIPAGEGWQARGEGGSLEPIVVDGWAQGWLVPPGDESTVVSYSPAGSLRAWSVVGGVAWALVLATWCVGAAVSVLSSRGRSRR